jgi:SagB-type dehydrogenase family enzyme
MVKVRHGLAMVGEPRGLFLEDNGNQRRWERGALEDPALAVALSMATDWTNAASLASALSATFEIDRQTAVAAIGGLIDGGLLVTDADPEARQAASRGLEWTSHGWADAFSFQWHTNRLPKMDYGADPAGEADKAMMRGYLQEGPPPSKYKAPTSGSVLALPPFETVRAKPIADVFADVVERPRKSAPMSSQEFSWFAYLLAGQTGTRKLPLTGAHIAKTSPSGGSRHPTEVYPIVLQVDGVPQGVYRYVVDVHGLQRLLAGPQAEFVASEVIVHRDRPSFPMSVVFVFATLFDRSMYRYRESRSYRVIHHDIGHLMQTSALLASALDRSSYRGYAFHDAAVDMQLGVNGLDEAAMAFAAIG